MLSLTRTWLLFIPLLFIGLGIGYAQQKTIKTFPVRTFYEDNGLISNSILAVAQSNSGELLFGTTKGISTFDGIRWGHIKNSETFPFYHRGILVTLPGDSLLQLGYDPQSKAVVRLYHQGEITEIASFPIKETHRGRRTFNAAVTKTNGKLKIALLNYDFLWFQEGLNSQWKKVKLPEEINYKDVTKLIYYQKTLHILTTKGLYSYQPNQQKFQQLWPSLLKDKVIVSATTSPDGEKLYLLGNNWVAQSSNNRLRFLATNLFEEEEAYSILSNYNIIATKTGRLVFQLDNSLFLLNPATGFLEPFRLTNSFASATPTAILEDNEQNLWFSTLRGVAMLNSLRFANMDKVVGLPDSEISTIFQIDSGTVLLGTNLGINILKDYHWQQKAQGDVLYSNSNYRIIDATRLNKQQIAVAGNSQGLGIITETNSYETKWYKLPDELLAVSVKVVNDKLLVGTNHGKVLAFEKGRFSVLLDLNHEQYIRRMSLDKTGHLLLLTPKGIFRYDGSTTERINADSPQNSNIYSLQEWKGRTLLGTAHGVSEFRQGKIIPLTDEIPVQRPVYSILLDKKGRLWMGTDKGVFVYDQQKLKNYNRYSGLAGQEVNRSALVEMKDGRIWIGTDRGLSIYDPHYDDERNVVPDIRLKEVRSNDRALDHGNAHQLPFDENNVEFVFQPLSFYQPEALQYRYRLLGMEQEWTYSDNYLQNSVRYTSLPPGTYHFTIQARLQDGDWSPMVVSPEIEVASAFYTRWWFILSAALFIGFLGYLTNSLLFHRSNEKRLKAAIKEKMGQVEQSESKFQAIWESMDTSVVVCDRNGSIRMTNPSFCRLFDRTEESMVGLEISSVVPNIRFSKEYIENWYRNPSVLRFEMELASNGNTYSLLSTFSYLDKLSIHEPLLVVGLKDISHQKQAEMKNLRLNELLVRQNRDLVKKELELASFNRELLKRQKELQTAMQVLEERNFELDQFVYKTSHDLRAPIASAIGLLNIMKMEGETSDWPRYIDLIMRSLQKQDSFIKAMLNFSKTARAIEKPELIVFDEFVEQCLFDLQYLPGFETINKRIKVNDPCGNFYSDKMKISIILANILSNSIKYRDTAKTSRLEIVIDVSAEHANLMISDNGIGVNKDYLVHIFDMFYRATERSDGSGLGLYIVKQTLERLGGKIEVTSELGVGSCFKITIPNLVKQASVAEANLVAQSGAGNEPTVLE